MQSNHNDIYKLTALRTGKDEQMYKDVGNAVFAELYKNLRRPKSLIIKLKGVGTWYLRKKRMEIILQNPPKECKITGDDYFSKLTLLEYENKKEIYNIFKDRMIEYEEYIKLKDIIKKERFKDQKIISHDRETSQDNIT